MRLYYSGRLGAAEQIDAEEQIAAILFEQTRLGEVEAQAVAPRILLAILARFRPELVTAGEGEL